MKNAFINLRLHFIMLLILGGIYPFAVVGIGQLAASHKANGSPITLNGKIIGFNNVGQNFDHPYYFWSRPSAVNYNAAATGGSNKGPTNPDYLKEVGERVKAMQAAHLDQAGKPVPADLVTASGSGIDPDISLEAALYQVGRVAKANSLPKAEIEKLIADNTDKPSLGLFGPEHVNVLALNLKLNSLRKSTPETK